MHSGRICEKPSKDKEYRVLDVMKVFLIGYMYSGKTTVGRLLARRLGVEFVDLDEEIERRYRISVPMMFSRYGEEAFRVLEHRTLMSLDQEDCLVATGGGTACSQENMDYMKQNGVVVYMKMEIEGILKRAARSRKVRPLLADKTEDERREFVTRQLAMRERYYMQADVTVESDTEEVNQLADMVAERVQKYK